MARTDRARIIKPVGTHKMRTWTLGLTPRGAGNPPPWNPYVAAPVDDWLALALNRQIGWGDDNVAPTAGTMAAAA